MAGLDTKDSFDPSSVEAMFHGHRLLNRPLVLRTAKPGAKNLLGNTRHAGEISERVFGSAVFKPEVRHAVIRLLSPRCPSAIFGLVPTGPVYPVNGHPARALPHIFKETLESALAGFSAQPAFTNSDPELLVVAERQGRRLCATTDHAAPRIISGRRAPVGRVSVRSPKTPARLWVPPPEVLRGEEALGAANATTSPNCQLTRRRHSLGTGALKHGPVTKRLTSDVLIATATTHGETSLSQVIIGKVGDYVNR